MKNVVLVVVLLSLSVQVTAQSEINAFTYDGKRVLLRSDQTWEYINLETSAPEKSALLEVTEVVEMDEACRLQIRMQNNLGYHISSLVPRLAVHNQDGVLYTTVSLSFTALKPTRAKYTSIQVTGLGCRDISQVLVFDAGRCKMGEIDQFNEEPGQCLSRIYVQPSDLINFVRAES